MMSATKQRLIPLYTTRGDLGAILRYPFLFNPLGEWIGWVTSKRAVYSVYGSYVGQISEEWRLLRPRNLDFRHPSSPPPQNPGKIIPPAHFPLPPLMPELPINQIDVLEDLPRLLPPMDSGEFKPDLE